jgi:hypothetical protein
VGEAENGRRGMSLGRLREFAGSIFIFNQMQVFGYGQCLIVPFLQKRDPFQPRAFVENYAIIEESPWKVYGITISALEEILKYFRSGNEKFEKPRNARGVN